MKKNKQGSSFHLSEDVKMNIMEALDHIYLARQYQAIIHSHQVPTNTNFENLMVKNVQNSEFSQNDNSCSEEKYRRSDKENTNTYRKRDTKIIVSETRDICIKDPSCQTHTLKSSNNFKKSPNSKGSQNSNLKLHSTKNYNTANIPPLMGVVTNRSLPYLKSESENSGKYKKSNKDQSKENWEQLSGSLSSSSASGETKFNCKQNKVTCMYRESVNQYWVMNVQDVSVYESVQKELMNSKEGIANPKVGNVYGCEFEGEIFRAVVLKIAPKLTVHFIDFGNIYSYEGKTECKKLSATLEKIPGLVYLVEFHECTPPKYFTEDLDTSFLVIKRTGQIHGNVPVVRIIRGPFGYWRQNVNDSEGQNRQQRNLPLQQVTNREVNESERELTSQPLNSEKEETPVKSKPMTKKLVFDDLTEISRGTVFLLPGLMEARYGIIVPEENGNPDDFFELLLSLNTSNMSPSEADVGQLVLISHTDNSDHIGRVLNKFDRSYYVHIFDIDAYVEVRQVYSVPEKFQDVLDHRVLLRMSEWFHLSAPSYLKLIFEITDERKDSVWPCCLDNCERETALGIGTLEKVPETDEGEFVSVFLKSGSSVEITNVSSSDNLYVRKSGDRIREKLARIKEKLSDYAPAAKNLICQPEVNDLCCIQSERDSLFYRGKIEKIGPENASVLLVDVGEVQNSLWRELKPIPSSLKSMPFLAIEINLAGVPPKPFENDKIKDYFRNLISRRSEVILDYERYLENVTLTEKETNTNLNEFIAKSIFEEAATQSNEKKMKAEDESKIMGSVKERRFYDSDLTNLDIKCGEFYDLVLLHLDEEEYESNYSFWMTDRNDMSFIYVNSIIAEEIRLYCERVSESYSPKPGELCLAQFEGVWYRGSTIDADPEADQFLIIFIDYGNVCTLSSAFIRRTLEKFVKVPVVAYSCRIVDSERFANNKSLKDKIRVYLKERINDCFSNVEICNFENDLFGVRISEIEKIIEEKEC